MILNENFICIYKIFNHIYILLLVHIYYLYIIYNNIHYINFNTYLLNVITIILSSHYYIFESY